MRLTLVDKNRCFVILFCEWTVHKCAGMLPGSMMREAGEDVVGEGRFGTLLPLRM
jgi:hypothetical protein